MFPSDDVDFFTVIVKDEPWKTSEYTSVSSKEIERILSQTPEVKYVETTISDNKSNILVQLFDKEIREKKSQRTSIELVSYFQKLFKKYKNQKISVTEMKKWPPHQSPVAFSVIVDDVNKINYAQKIAEDLKDIKKNTLNKLSKWWFK